jgi:hypothetical protein
MAIVAIPIQPVQDPVSNNGFTSARLIEELTQTFKIGTPVALTAADGGVKAWDGSTGVAFIYGAGTRQGGIIGFSYEPASTLTATGLGAPTPFSPFLGVGAVAGTFGSVPNQASAKNIAHGAPINDGRVGFVSGTPTIVWSATFGNAGNTATPAATDVSQSYGLTVDTTANFWYVDKSKNTRGTNTVLIVVGLDPRDTPSAGSRILFVLDPNFTNLNMLV